MIAWRNMIISCSLMSIAACAFDQNKSKDLDKYNSTVMTEKTNTNKNDFEQIAGEWVEIREESTDGKLVFRSIDSSIPPARGRRHLELIQDIKSENNNQGVGESLESGATDKLESASAGNWKLDNKVLQISIPGWEGEYQIEKLQDDIMILRKVEKQIEE